MPVPAPNALSANASALDNAQASQAVSVQVNSIGAQITRQNKGRSVVQIQLPVDQNGTTHYRIVIVTVVGAGEPPVD